MIAGVVLAAGAGQRIGHPKALLRTDREGESFVERACDALRAGGAHAVIVVVSEGLADAVRVRVGAARVIVNADPSRGQLSSLQAALAALSPDVDALVVLPVDVPLVRIETIRTLIARWQQRRLPVVRPVHAGRHGHPVVLDRAVFPELAAAPLSEGAKPVVRRHASAAGEIVTADEGAFTDIDTVEDYRAAFGRLPEGVELR